MSVLQKGFVCVCVCVCVCVWCVWVNSYLLINPLCSPLLLSTPRRDSGLGSVWWLWHLVPRGLCWLQHSGCQGGWLPVPRLSCRHPDLRPEQQRTEPASPGQGWTLRVPVDPESCPLLSLPLQEGMTTGEMSTPVDYQFKAWSRASWPRWQKRWLPAKDIAASRKLPVSWKFPLSQAVGPCCRGH